MSDKIIIDYGKLKSKLLNILLKLNVFYTNLNSALVSFWRKILEKQSPNWFTKALLTLLNNPATTLLLNTLLFAAIGKIFGGNIELAMFYLCALNIIVFCAKILGWEDKLK